ncbi:MAG: hypothetical protein KAU38_16180 [Desulfobacterales bacterium]|nr:hypothetical protein [Desulfobacterales bacterium]
MSVKCLFKDNEVSDNIAPTYNVAKSYEYNFIYGPFYDGGPLLRSPTDFKYKLLDFEINSPLGVAAGLLLNSKWVRLYSELGFDILTYKTVRSSKRKSYSHPNCLYIDYADQLDLDESPLTGKEQTENVSIDTLSITNSLGVPSDPPDKWRKHISEAKSYLKAGQVLIVSVVGTAKQEGDIDSFVKDFQVCARWAKEAGADIIELDLSCPNSPVAEGDIFKDRDLSSMISKAVKKEIKDTPLFIKIGYLDTYEKLKSVIQANAPFINGVAGINGIKKRIVSPNGIQALPGEGREESGVCGSIIRKLGLKSAERLVRLREKEKYNFAIIGVGGAMIPEHIEEYLDIGVDAVQVVTAAMWDPYLAYKYNQYVVKTLQKYEQPLMMNQR